MALRSLTAVGLLLERLEELLASFNCVAPVFYRISILERRWGDRVDTSGLRAHVSAFAIDLRRLFTEMEGIIHNSIGGDVNIPARPRNLKRLFDWTEGMEGTERLEPFYVRSALEQLFSHLLAIRHDLSVELEELCERSRNREFAKHLNKPQPISDPFLCVDLLDAIERKGHTARQAAAVIGTTPETFAKLLRGGRVADRIVRSAIQYAYSDRRLKEKRQLLLDAPQALKHFRLHNMRSRVMC